MVLRHRQSRDCGERPRWRALLGAFLTFMMAMGAYPIFALAALAPFILRDLDLSRAALGSISTGVLVMSAVAAPFAGVLADWLPGRWLSVGVLSLAALALCGMALAPTIHGMLAAGCVYGLAAGCTQPLTNQALTERVPPGARARIMGVKHSGVQAAALVCGLLLPSMALLVGWRASLVASGVAIALSILVVPFALAGGRGSVGLHPSSGRVSMRGLGALAWRMTLYAALMGFAGSAVMTYVVLYGVEEIRLSAVSAGLAAGLTGLAGVVARIAWAETSRRTGATLTLLATLSLGGAVFVGLLWSAGVVGAWALWLAAIGFGATAASWAPVANLALLDGSASVVSGRVSGVMQAGFYTGCAVAPLAVGLLVDRTRSYAVPWAAVIITLLAAAAWLGTFNRPRSRGPRR